MSTTQRVLVVEDDRLIREVIATTLADEGYSVDVVEDGAQAWAYLAERRPHLVVLDLALPRLDGLTLCRRLRSQPATAGLPVLVVSAMTGSATVQSAFDAGADAFLDKPFDLSELLDQVRTLAGGGEVPALSS